MPMTKGMYSSNTPEWETPQALFDELNAEFHFTLDVCATPENAKCKRYFTEKENGLKQSWLLSISTPSICWMNPPYGRKIGKWIEKAYSESKRGNTVVCLVPARTDTAWWHDYVMRGEIRFLRGRVKFGSSKQGAPFPSAIVIFKNQQEPFAIYDGCFQGEKQKALGILEEK